MTRKTKTVFKILFALLATISAFCTMSVIAICMKMKEGAN